MSYRSITIQHPFHIILFTLAMLCSAKSGWAQWTRLSNLPAIYIDTYNNTRVVSKTNYVWAAMHYVDEQDNIAFVTDSVEIRGRGNSTWNLPKKPYKLKFNEKQKLLGKGYAKAKKWILLANAGDKTMMRNALTSALGEFAQLKFNPAYKFVDLVLNGEYLGTYQLTDQIDVRPHRVNITEQDYPITLNSDITGGYLLEVDGFRDGNYFITSRYSVPIRIHYPDADEIAASQNAYIRSYIADFENRLRSANFTDPVQGYRSLVDSVSLANWYICTEVSANIDGFFSLYFYKEQQQKELFWGPLWDYDIAYNNDWRIGNEKGLSTTAQSLMKDIAYGNARMWVVRMWEDPWFGQLIQRRYQELLDQGLVSHLQGVVDSLYSVLNESQQLNYQRWGIDTRSYHEWVLYSSYDAYVADLKTFVREHCAWLKRAFSGNTQPEPTPAFEPEMVYYRIVNVRTNKALELSADGLATQYRNAGVRTTADWYIRAAGNGHFQVINRESGKALNDPTQGASTATTNVGTQLNAAVADGNDDRQLWDLLPQGTEGYYNLLNVHTQHVANLQGGNEADGTPVLSYTNDSRNGSSTNRLWYIIPTTTPVEDMAGIDAVEPDAYALAYNSNAQHLHFGAEHAEQLSFVARVYNLEGKLIGSFRANETFSMTAMPAGIYIVAWNVGGKPHSVKFRKR